MLKKVFFSLFSNVDLSDLQSFIYLAFLKCSITITEKEVTTTLKRFRLDKTSSSNEIINRLLKACTDTLTKLLTSLFQICVTLKYHSRIFKETHTIALKKSEKVDYTTSKTYRSIALLNTLRKTLEFIMTEKIAYLIERFQLLSETQMRDRKSRSTNTTLELLIEQIHTI